MTITINHGSPNTPFFMVAFPKRQYTEPRGCDGKTTITLVDEKAKTNIIAAFFGCYEVEISDFHKYNSYARLAYGISATELKTALLKKYPELNSPGAIVEYWILKRI